MESLRFFKVNKDLESPHIEALFNDTINWTIIETDYKDLFQVALSIRAEGTASTLLRKLNNDSKKNKLYQAFRELGNAIRTIYLLEFISNVELREKITESTNKVEAYNWFLKCFLNAVILHNAIDINIALEKLAAEGVIVTKEDIKL